MGQLIKRPPAKTQQYWNDIMGKKARLRKETQKAVRGKELLENTFAQLEDQHGEELTNEILNNVLEEFIESGEYSHEIKPLI